MKHQQPGMRFSFGEGAPNVMSDLAYAMKMNPGMRVLLAGGYFDLATPFFEGIYEMRHLPIPQKLQQNISYKLLRVGAHGVRERERAEAVPRRRGELRPRNRGGK